MRILHVVPTYLPATRYGGPIYSVNGLAQAQAELGHDVHVFTTNIDGPGVSPVPVEEPVILKAVKVWYFRCGIGRRIYRSPGMGAALNRDVATFDIVHLHSVFLWPTVAAARAAERANVPYLLAPRGMLVADLFRKKSRALKLTWIALFERHTIERAAAVHVTSNVEADEIKALGLKPKRTVVVPNGVVLPECVGPMNAGDIADRRPYVLSLGRISWKKRLDRLIAAMVHVPEVDLVIAGNDEEGLRPKLEAQARVIGLGDRVHFVGAVQGARKWSLMQGAKAFALPSENENFGIVVLEAMAAAVPVIVTPQVGLAAAVERAGAGVVAEGEPSTFGAALASLLADPERMQAMGWAGRQVARESFSWRAIADEMESIYTTLRESAK
ncbi:glycosyltransferase [Methylocystis sp.]|uniref:glycosyltransferase n=1 Tax=Methylocystis sp. TaxID=1911079 RepID=UPI003DA5444C